MIGRAAVGSTPAPTCRNDGRLAPAITPCGRPVEWPSLAESRGESPPADPASSSPGHGGAGCLLLGGSVFLLNRFFEVMEQAIRRHGGVVDKFLGDGIMALFGATSTPERGSRDALLAAGTMLEALEGLNAEFHTSLPEPLRMG